MKSLGGKFSLLTLLAAAFFVLPVNAQWDPCALKIKAIALETSTVVWGTTGTAVDIDTNKTFKAIPKESGLYFPDLVNMTTYKITLSKAGYKRTITEIMTNCLSDNRGMTETVVVSMQKGSSKLTYEPPKDKQIALFRTGQEIRSTGDSDHETTTPDSPFRIGNERGAPLAAGSKRKIISKGVINGSAISLPKPEYSDWAKAAGASGAVNVQVTLDEQGNVTSASAVSGDSRLRSAAAEAARSAKFRPTLLDGQPVKVSGIIVYNFQ